MLPSSNGIDLELLSCTVRDGIGIADAALVNDVELWVCACVGGEDESESVAKAFAAV